MFELIIFQWSQRAKSITVLIKKLHKERWGNFCVCEKWRYLLFYRWHVFCFVTHLMQLACSPLRFHGKILLMIQVMDWCTGKATLTIFFGPRSPTGVFQACRRKKKFKKSSISCCPPDK